MKEYNIIPLEGARNVRDIGGIAIANGKKTAMNVFIRADGLGDLTGGDMDKLLEYGLDCIIDLRSQREVERKPDSLYGHEKIFYANIPMLDQIQSNISKEELQFPSSMQAMYIGLLDYDGSFIRRVFEILCDPGYRCTVFHCTAGKDRTGLIAMLMLDAAGASRDDILRNYAISGELILPDLDPEAAARLPAYVFESRPEFMAAAYDHLQTRYQGARSYLLEQGITAGQLDALMDKLIAK